MTIHRDNIIEHLEAFDKAEEFADNLIALMTEDIKTYGQEAFTRHDPDKLAETIMELIRRYSDIHDTQIVERSGGESRLEGYAIVWYDGTPKTEFQTR